MAPCMTTLHALAHVTISTAPGGKRRSWGEREEAQAQRVPEMRQALYITLYAPWVCHPMIPSYREGQQRAKGSVICPRSESEMGLGPSL